jgi:hypothetical protein
VLSEIFEIRDIFKLKKSEVKKLRQNDRIAWRTLDEFSVLHQLEKDKDWKPLLER